MIDINAFDDGDIPFTENLRRALRVAQDEALELAHNSIGTGHLLLGLAHQTNSSAGRRLRQLDVTVEDVSRLFTEFYPPGDLPPTGSLPSLTDNSREALQQASDQAQQQADSVVSTSRLLSALASQSQGRAAQMLARLGVDLSTYLAPGIIGTLKTGTVLRGRYRIEGLLGVGGMSAVYQARDLNYPEVTRLCAVKEMINLASDPAMHEANFRNFQREATILSLLNHPAIPEIYDYFMEGDRAYMMIEYIIGKDLEALLNSTDAFLPVAQVRLWAIEICDALDYLHNFKPDPIIFRDLKPSNVMIDQYRKARLIDFGMAMNFQIGNTQSMLRTEGYAPPEQYRGEVSARSDIYALGATLHHMLTRRDPRREPPFSFARRPIEQFNESVPQGMIDNVNRALAYDAADRWASAAEMKAALETLGGK